MKKRFMVLALVIAMLCTASASALELSAPGVLPLVTEEVVLTIGLPLQPECTDYYDNYFTHFAQEKTGVTLAFELLPSSNDEAKQKISLMVTAGEKLPDILNVGLSTAERASYGASGIFIPLNDYLANDAYFTELACAKWLNESEYEALPKYGTSPDGNIYALPSYSTTIDSTSALGMWINKNWLDALNLEAPKTTEDLYNVLVAFRDNDPNGNGIADEIPLVGTTSWAGSVVTELLNSFLYYCYTGAYGYQLNAEDGKLVAPFVQEEFREGMRYINKLYSEGLISPLSFTQTTAELRIIMTATEGDTLVGAFTAHPSPVFGSTGDVERVKEYIALPAMIGPEGVSWTAHEASLPSYSVSITSSCENPDLAFRFLDALREETLNLSSRFGEEGVDWRYEDEGNILVPMEGYFPYFMETTDTRPSPWTSANNIIWGTTSFSFLPNKLMGAKVAPEWPTELRAYQMQTLWYDSVPLRSGNCPEERPLALIYTEEEMDEIGEIETSIHSFVDESTNRFLTGDLSLDTDWDSYLSTLKSIGLDYYMEVAQKVYDRMNGK